MSKTNAELFNLKLMAELKEAEGLLRKIVGIVESRAYQCFIKEDGTVDTEKNETGVHYCLLCGSNHTTDCVIQKANNFLNRGIIEQKTGQE